MELTSRDLQRLKGVHPDLMRVIQRAAKDAITEFRVLEGLRSLERQKELLAQGATRTLNSRHLTGHAVDLAPVIGGVIRWDWPLYYKLADLVKKSAEACAVPIEWGGDWRTFKDGPHFQLSVKEYPK